jgi:multiple sugar transport system permease protein
MPGLNGSRRLMTFLTVYIPLVIVLFVVLFPFYWMLAASLKPYPELFNVSVAPLWVADPTLEHYQKLFFDTLYVRWFINSFTVSLASTAISLVIGTLAGYAAARLRFRGVRLITTLILVSYLVPRTLLFIPMSQIVYNLNLTNSLWSMILTYPTFLVPFQTWLMAGYFRTIPSEIEDCARIDGCHRLQALWHVVLPLARPGIVSAAIFGFTLSWAEFLYGSSFVSFDKLKTLPAGVVTSLIRADAFFWGPLMAAALLGSVPVALIYMFFVEQYVAGLTAGAVKG